MIPFEDDDTEKHEIKKKHKPDRSVQEQNVRTTSASNTTSPRVKDQAANDATMAPTNGQPLLIDVPTLAAQLSVTIRFVRRLIAEDRIPYLKIGKFIRFDPSEINSWIDEQRVRAG